MNINNKNIIGALFFSLLGVLLSPPALATKAIAQTPFGDAYCMRCHGMKTLSYQDPKSGDLVDLFIDKTARSHSSHKNQSCESCHKGDFEEYPHDIALQKQAQSCPDCHKDKPELAKYRFDKIAVQFSKSVHYKKHSDEFTCYTCHDLHNWQISPLSQSTDELVLRSNQSCVGCHQKPEQLDKPTLKESHNWLPSTGLHMESIRCVECHTPRPGSVVHAIVPASRAEKNCESCHTKDSILLTKLYKYRLQESERSAGFINGVVLSDSYVIGMTRHPILDTLGILMVAFTGLGVAAHGLGRWIAAKRRRES